MKYMSQGAGSIYEVITHNPEGLERASWRREREESRWERGKLVKRRDLETETEGE